MKKILALLLAAMMVVALCACGGSSDSAAEAPAEEAAAPAEAAPEAPAEAAPAAPAQEAPASDEPSQEPAEAAPAAAGEVTWADYQAYLIEKAGGNSPDPDEFAAQVNALTGWDDIDTTTAPWDQMFTTIGLSTWEEFQAGNVKEPLVVGGPDASASGEASGDPTEEPAA